MNITRFTYAELMDPIGRFTQKRIEVDADLSEAYRRLELVHELYGDDLEGMAKQLFRADDSGAEFEVTEAMLNEIRIALAAAQEFVRVRKDQDTNKLRMVAGSN